MRKLVPMALALTIAAAGVPVDLVAAGPATGSLTGIAYKPDLRPLPNVSVQVRDVKTANPVLMTRSGPRGEFAFPEVQPGSYIVELWDATGRVTGMSAPFTVAPGASLNVSVVEVAGGAVKSSSGAGFSLLGLGPTATIAVLGAAGASAVTAVVATRPVASPSR